MAHKLTPGDNMKLSEILSNTESTDAEKVSQINAVVAKARAAYGNENLEISEPEIYTLSGLQDLAMLSDESKVAIVELEIEKIKTQAVEFVKNTEGAVLDRKIEELIATSPLLANITAKVESSYL
jgi:hypothetical protein